MNANKAPLTSQLMLLVLSLIIVCLVLLVIRAYNTKSASEPSQLADTSQSVPMDEPAPVEPSASVPPQTVQRTMPRSSPTNIPRAVPVNRLSATPPVVPPVEPVQENPPETPTPLAAPVPVLVVEVPVIAAPVAPNPGSGVTEVLGIATLLGTPRPEIPIDLGPSCGRINPNKVTTRHFVVGRDNGLANVFVYVKDAQRTSAAGETPLLDQVGCMYEPYVMGVVAGQRFKIRNSDPELHNVHATPSLNREFNFGQPRKGQVNERSFTRPEVFVRIKCDVHPWMFAYIGVVDHPFFATTDTNGLFRLPASLPGGNYTVTAVHVKAGEINQQISVQPGERKVLNFQFTLPPAFQPQGRVATAK